MKTLLLLIIAVLPMIAAADSLSEFSDVLKAGDAVQLATMIQQADGQLPRGPRNGTLLHSATS